MRLICGSREPQDHSLRSPGGGATPPGGGNGRTGQQDIEHEEGGEIEEQGVWRWEKQTTRLSFHIACLYATRHRKVYFGTLSHLKDDPNKVVNDFVFEQYFRPQEHVKVLGNCQSAKTTTNCPKKASKILRIDQKLI